MKGLSLTQPWATLVAIGAKQFETRSWRPTYRGRIAIQAAKGMPLWADELTLREPFYQVLKAEGYNGIDQRLPRGVIVAVADLVECLSTGSEGGPVPDWLYQLNDQERAFGDFTPGRWAWRLESVKRLPRPVACRGYQLLWGVEADVAAAIYVQLAAAA